MKITVLAENTAVCKDIGYEHGLSLYIETDSKRILFDMGQSDLFAENAKKLGIDLGVVDIAILSHGHYDHGGGLRTFMEINKTAPIYINVHAFGKHYNGVEKYIGLDMTLKDNERFVFTDDVFEIEKGLTLYSCNNKEYELLSTGLNVKENGVMRPDTFIHEQYLLIEEEKRVLISGCSHKGIMNVVKWFEPQVLIGGFHFSKFALDDTLKGYAEYLDSFDTDFYTCHCTGVDQYKFMSEYMSRLKYLSGGTQIEL